MSNEPKSYPRREFLGQVAAVPALAAIAAQWNPPTAAAQGVAADPLVVPQLAEADLVREVESLMRFVDPEIAYRHVPIDPERNAWPLWKQAMDAYVKEPEHFDAEDSISEFEGGGPPPRPELLKELRDWVQQNEPARRLTDEGIARGAYERPLATKSIALDFDTGASMGLRDLARLKNTRCQLLLLDERIDEALAEAQAITRLAQIMLQAESLFIDYLIASGIVNIAVCSAYSVALNRHATRDHARSAIAMMDHGPDGERFVQAHRVELCRWFLPKLARMPQSSDSSALATALLTPDWAPENAPNEKQLAETKRAIGATARILQGHPSPFDREATVRLANELHRKWFAELKKPYWERSENCFQSLFTEVAAWPNFAKCDASVGLFDSEPHVEPRPTEEDYERSRLAIRAIENVVGKYMLADQYGVRWLDSAEMHEVRLRSLQLRIALSHFEREHGELPATLDALVGDGWFSAVPLDPYDGQAFRYSRGDRLIWSVGRDGDNDPFGKDRLESDDAFEGHLKGIWKIPRRPAA